MTKLVVERYGLCWDINCEDLARRVAPQNAISNFTDRRREMYPLNSYLGALLFLPAASVHELQMRESQRRRKEPTKKKKPTCVCSDPPVKDKAKLFPWLWAAFVCRLSFRSQFSDFRRPSTPCARAACTATFDRIHALVVPSEVICDSI